MTNHFTMTATRQALLALAVGAACNAQNPNLSINPVTGTTTTNPSPVAVASCDIFFQPITGGSTYRGLQSGGMVLGKPAAASGLGEVHVATYGNVVSTYAPLTPTGFRFLVGPPTTTDGFGYSVAGLEYDRKTIAHQVALGSPGRGGNRGMVAIHDVHAGTTPPPVRAIVANPFFGRETGFGATVRNLGDLDNDGHEDLGIGTNDSVLVLNSATIESIAITQPSTTHPVLTTDPGVLIRNHPNVIDVEDPLRGTRRASAPAGVGDISGDLVDDYAVVVTDLNDDTQKREIEFWNSTGAAPFLTVSMPSGGDYYIDGGRDLDRDREPDVVALRYQDSGPQLFLLLSSAGYAPSAAIPTVAGARDVVLTDYDDDRYPDVAVGSATQGVQYFQWNVATGTVTAQAPLTSTIAGFGADLAALDDQAIQSAYALAIGATSAASASFAYTSNQQGLPPNGILRQVADAPADCQFGGQSNPRPTVHYRGGINPTSSAFELVVGNAVPGYFAQLFLEGGAPNVATFLGSPCPVLSTLPIALGTYTVSMDGTLTTGAFPTGVTAGMQDLQFQFVLADLAMPNSVTTTPIVWLNF